MIDTQRQKLLQNAIHASPTTHNVKFTASNTCPRRLHHRRIQTSAINIAQTRPIHPRAGAGKRPPRTHLTRLFHSLRTTQKTRDIRMERRDASNVSDDLTRWDCNLRGSTACAIEEGIEIAYRPFGEVMPRSGGMRHGLDAQSSDGAPSTILIYGLPLAPSPHSNGLSRPASTSQSAAQLQ